ncbi:hypothetical protein [Paracidovorax avenae]|uniref:hypothetical protein n=1 Tax=Paracidovorax avenae TaxID=80867 RepID=UPI000AC9217C|nr:hypothetical protein [Paracidovorax avenae]
MPLLPTDTDRFPANARLAVSVEDAHGQLLLRAGADVTPGVLRALREYGIHAVQVDEAPQAAPFAVPPAQDPVHARARIEERLRHLFRGAIGAGQINPLFHLVLEHRLRSERHDH